MPNTQKLLLKAIKAYQPQTAILFGSYTQGTSDKYSDIDLLMVKNTPKRFLDRLIEFSSLIDPQLPKVDAFIYTPKEFQLMKRHQNPIVTQALKHGQTIYEAT